MKHILLNKDFEYKKRKIFSMPNNFFYDNKYGALLSIHDKLLLVNDDTFPAITTKKRDIETGEDVK